MPKTSMERSDLAQKLNVNDQLIGKMYRLANASPLLFGLALRQKGPDEVSVDEIAQPRNNDVNELFKFQNIS